MAGTQIVVDVHGMDEVMRVLDKLSIADIEKLVSFAGGQLHFQSMKAFEDETDPVTGKKWKAVKTRRGRGSGPILHAGGTLQKSVEEKSTGVEAIVCSSMKYGRIHNLGGKAGRGRKVTIPQRRYIGHSEDWPRELMGEPYVRKLMEPTA